MKPASHIRCLQQLISIEIKSGALWHIAVMLPVSGESKEA